MMTTKTLSTILMALLLAATALAGCISDSGSELDTDAGDDGDTSGNQTFSGGNESLSDDPPTVVVTVSGDNVTANETDNSTTYGAPVGANVTFDASDSTDPADGNLTFAWDLGDGNTTEGATVSYTYGTAGNYTVTVTATSDASDLSSSESVVVAAEAAGDVPEPVVITGSAIIPNPVIGPNLLCFRDGIDGDAHEIAPAAPGWNYALEPADSFTVYWFDEGDSYMETGDDEGVVPDGAAIAEICQDVSVLGDYTLTLTHPDYVA